MPAPSPAWRPHTAAQTVHPKKRSRRNPNVPSASPRTWSTRLYSEGPWHSTSVQFTKNSQQATYELGGAPGPTIDQGIPRAPYNNLRKQTSRNFTYRLRNTWKHLGTGKAIKTSHNFTTGYATLKNTWAQEEPLPSTGAELRPVRKPARAPRALPNNFYKILRKWCYPHKKNYITKYHTLALQNNFTNKKLPRG